MPNKVPIQKYFENIKIKTGKTPADFKKIAMDKGFFEKGVLKPTVKAGEVIAWLQRTANKVLPKWGLTEVIQHLYFYQPLCYIWADVFQMPPLRQYPER